MTMNVVVSLVASRFFFTVMSIAAAAELWQVFVDGFADLSLSLERERAPIHLPAIFAAPHIQTRETCLTHLQRNSTNSTY